jgi:hypothetical protein
LKLAHSTEISAKDKEISEISEKNALVNKKCDEFKFEVERLE